MFETTLKIFCQIQGGLEASERCCSSELLSSEGVFHLYSPTTEKCLDNQTDHCTYSLLWHDIQFDRERISPSARNHRSNMARVRQAFDHAGILIHTSSREEDQAS